MIVQIQSIVLIKNAKIPVLTRIILVVCKQTVCPKITGLFANVLRVGLEILTKNVINVG